MQKLYLTPEDCTDLQYNEEYHIVTCDIPKYYRKAAFAYDDTIYVDARYVYTWRRLFLGFILKHERNHLKLITYGVPFEYHHAIFQALRL